MQFFGSNIKKFLIFSEKKAFLIFQETSYISGSNFPNSKYEKKPLLKGCLYFEKWNLRFAILELRDQLRNRVTQNDVTLRVTNSKMFTEILLLSY